MPPPPHGIGIGSFFPREFVALDQSTLKGNLGCATDKHRGEESKHLVSFNLNTTGRVPKVVVEGAYHCKNVV